MSQMCFNLLRMNQALLISPSSTTHYAVVADAGAGGQLLMDQETFLAVKVWGKEG